jgi:D-serine deaminase-like pyridoxal phosphate-dependent protein
VVVSDVLEANVRAMAALASANGKRLRPHLKTHKCLEIARLQQAHGIHGVTVAKLAEAEVFAQAGFRDIFVANLIVGSDKLERLAKLASIADVTVGLDSEAVLAGLAACARTTPQPIGVYIEVDAGHHRTGVRTTRDVGRLAAACRSCPGLELRGVYTHEGHVYRVPPEDITSACAAVETLMTEAAGHAGVETISVGSTPGARAMASMRSIAELRPGNYVFHDAMQVRMGAPLHSCALMVAATVIATPSDTDAFVDAGSKALSGDRDPDGRYGFLADRPAIAVDWCSEEHGHLNMAKAPRSLRVGDRVRIIPAHACTCVNCHDRLYAVQDDQVIGVWPVAARGKLT